MGEVRETKRDILLEFMKLNADKPWHVNEIEPKIGWPPSQISTALSRFCRDMPQFFEQLGKGIYIYRSVAKEIVKPVADSFIVEVLARQDEYILVKNSDTDELYTLKQFRLGQ